MCFSAAGSFAVSGVLTVIGGASLARNSSRPRRMFASIPLIFAAQQAAEGVVWLTLGDPHHATLHRAAVNGFLGVALIVWTTWLPCSLRALENDPARRRLLTALFGFGALIALYATVLLALWPPTARIAGQCMTYDHPKIHDSAVFIYLSGYAVPSITPFFVSTARRARSIGVALVASLIAAFLVERNALTSVWCFFAAVLSCLIWRIVSLEEQSNLVQQYTPLRA